MIKELHNSSLGTILSKIFRIMKLTTFFLIVGISIANAFNTYSQSTILSLEAENKSIRDIFNEIEKNTEFIFFYNDATLDVNKTVRIQAKEQTVEKILDQLFKGTDLTYSIDDRQIFIMEKGEIIENATSIKVSGRIRDKNGEPMIGVNIQEVGTHNISVSDMDGNFSISVTVKPSLLRFSYIGYKTQEIKVEGSKILNITLEEDSETLNEVVVVGYGSLGRKTMTSAVSNIKQEEFQAGTASPLMAIQGQVSGLSVQSTNGSDPNAGVSLQLRGTNSINASQGPLIVIDGIPGADMELVAKEDIESINVLKDASAAAIYGTRASGGVILITTKRPQIGKASVNFTSELSIETVRKRPDILSAQEFRDYGRTTLGGAFDYGASTNWFDEITRKAPFSQRYVLNAGGGTENARLSATINYRKANGMAIGSDRAELGGRINTYFKFLNNRLELSSNVSYTNIKANLTNNEIFEKTMMINPTYPVYDETTPSGYNVIVGQAQMFNPVAEIKLASNALETNMILANSSLKLNITDFWSATATVAIKQNSAYQIQSRSAQHRLSQESGVTGWGNQDYRRNIDKTFDFTTNLDKSFGDHSINAVLGYSFQEFGGQGFSAGNSNFPVDAIGVNDLGAGTYLAQGNATMSSFKDPRIRLISFFGRANYAFKERYLLTATLRHEGSSKFYQNRWGTFPGISLGWRISSEEFMKQVSFINDLKLRAGYGETGNEGFDSTTAFRMFSLDSWAYANNEWIRVYGLKHNQVKDMKWEIKREFDVGLDFSVLKNKLNGRLDWYKRKIDRLIYQIPVASPPNVYDNAVTNAGNMENTGFELELNWNVLEKKDWNYNMNLVASTNKSKLTSLGTEGAYVNLHTLPHPGSPGTAVRITSGQDIGQYFIFKSAGFDDEGKALIYDRNDKIVPYEGNNYDDNRRYIGNAIPKVTLSWGHNVRYKNWDLSVYMRSWLGYDVFNVSDMYYGVQTSFNNGRNVLKSAYGRNSFIKNDTRLLTDYWLEKGNFLKIDVITLGYTFNKAKIHPFSNLRVYLTGRDLFTITGYRGMDPEVNVNGLEPGFEDVTAYPRTRTFMFGLQVGF